VLYIYNLLMFKRFDLGGSLGDIVNMLGHWQ
jgi:hypothetical protein